MNLVCTDRIRLDIEWVEYEHGIRWVAKDPLSGSFYYFGNIERAAAKLLDGHQTLRQIVNTLVKHFPNQPVSEQWLQGFISKLMRAGLLIPNARSSSQYPQPVVSSWIVQTILSPLSFRLPIWKPRSFSIGFHVLASILFHPFLVASLFFAIPVCAFLFVHSILANPDQAIYDIQRIQGERWAWMLIAYLVVKSLHELGHVLACAKWKADCKEIGFLFLFFAPCLYCDTTDSWKLSSRWQRASIAAAGIYVELWIACIACGIWYFTRNGLEHTVAASIMIMCSVGTILINGNPCFKYDGYYILSDLWRVPNLSQQSSTALWMAFLYCLGGRKPDASELDKDYRLLACFALVSTVYRLSVLFFLIWLVWFVLVPKGLGFLSIFVFATMAIGMMLQIVRFLTNLMTEFYSPMPIRLMRTAVMFALLAGGIYLAATLPIPNSVRARCFLDFEDKSPVYATQTAVLSFVAPLDFEFEKEQVILKLDCPEKVLELQNLKDEIAMVKTKYNILRKSAVNDPAASFELPSLMELVKELESRRSLMETELDSLVQKAPGPGFFIPQSTKIVEPITPPNHIGFSNSVMDPSNLGCTVERGAILGWFSSKGRIQFHTLVSEADLKSLRMAMPASCILDAATSKSVDCFIKKISPEPVAEIPLELLGDPMVVTVRNKKGAFQPETPHYLVTLEARSRVSSGLMGTIGSVHFQLDPKTLTDSVGDYLRSTFRPK